jgi:hypothetical protein
MAPDARKVNVGEDLWAISKAHVEAPVAGAIVKVVEERGE